MARRHNAEGKQRNISKRVATLERELKAMTKEAPPRPEDVVARQAMKGERPDYLTVTRGNADYGTPTAEHLKRL